MPGIGPMLKPLVETINSSGIPASTGRQESWHIIYFPTSKTGQT